MYIGIERMNVHIPRFPQNPEELLGKFLVKRNPTHNNGSEPYF